MLIIRKRKNWILGVFLFLTVFLAMLNFIDVTVAVDNQPPVVVLYVSSYVIDEGEILTFDVSDSYDPEGRPLKLRWKYGTDATWGDWLPCLYHSMRMSDSTKNPITIMVQVTDGVLESSAQATITVNNLPPTVDAGPDIVVYNGAQVTFRGSYSDPGKDIVSVTWDFGDGDSSSGAKHIYLHPGNYTATLTVEDDEGASASDTVAVCILETSTPAIIFVCNEAGDVEDDFRSYDNPIYVKGVGAPNQEIVVYIVDRFTAWEDGISLSSLSWASGGIVTADSEGNIPVTMIWEPTLRGGTFDVFVDVNSNGVYDEGVDIVIQRAFSVVPEGQLGALVTTLILAVFAIALIKQKKYLKSKSLGRDVVA